MEHVEADVCIIGAGFAGLAAGCKLTRAGKSVAVLEARERVGGRVFTEVLPDGTPLNWGGTFIGEGHDRLYALVKEMGLQTCRQYTKGDNLLFLDGKRHRYAGNVPRINPLALVDFGLAAKTLEWMAGAVSVESPWDADGAREYDTQTLGAWIESRWHARTGAAQQLLRAVFTEVFMSDPSEVSLLHALQVLHSLRSLEWISGAEGGAQQDVVVGGMQAVAERLAQKLGGAVRLKSPVRCLRHDAAGVSVVGDSLTVRAGRVICAIPPILAARMDFDPPLPSLKSQLMDRSPAGQCIRCYAVYPEPFWRADGLTGQGADLDAAPQASIDLTPPAGKPGVLTAYIWGPPARHAAALPAVERRQTFLDGMVKRFGTKAAAPVHYREVDWAAEPWTRGDMFAHYAPGVLTGFGRALREPCGRVHWAGTETAMAWVGSIEGAIRSGERASDEVMNAG